MGRPAEQIVDTRPTSSAGPFFDGLGRFDDHPALVAGDRVLTYHELEQQIIDVAEELAGEPRLVAVEATNDVGSIVSYLAGLRARQPVLLLPTGSSPAAERLIRAFDPDVVVSSGAAWRPEHVRRRSTHRLHPDLALLLSTSGSTGSTKLVRLGREGLHANASAIAAYLKLDASDRAITTLPLHYCYGLSVLNSHLAVGGSLVLQHASVVDPCFWRTFSDHAVTNFAGVPHTFDLLDRVEFTSMALPSLRFVTQAGGRLQADSVRRLAAASQRRGWDLYVMYGQTEATARMAYLPPALAESHPAAIGVAIPGGHLEIDPEGCDPDVGEIVYRGPNVMLGYANEPADLARGREVHELRTGDLGRRVDGIFEVTGRRSRFIKPFGVRVDLDHLETILAEASVDALCTGDDELLAIATVAEPMARTARQVVADCTGLPAKSIAIAVVETLPRLANGKPDHASVRALTEQHPQGANEVGSSVGSVAAVYEAVLGTRPALRDSFVTAGGDSLSYVEVAIRLEEVLGAVPPNWHLRSIADLEAARFEASSPTELDTTVAIRALMIILIVGTHTDLWRIVGGAHLLLAVAGFNYARFQLTARGAWRSARRIAAPAIAWIGVAVAVEEDFSLPHALLLNGVLGQPDARWAYWFIEALVQILLVLAAVTAIPTVGRAASRAPFVAGLVALAAGLAIRFDPFGVDLIGIDGLDHHLYRPQAIFWLFALGWVAATARTGARRLATTGLILASVPGFFDEPARDALVSGGLLLVLWLPTVPVPMAARRTVSAIAAASLWIYLTHWQVYPPFARHVGSTTALLASLAVGVAAHRLHSGAADAIDSGIQRARVRREASERAARGRPVHEHPLLAPSSRSITARLPGHASKRTSSGTRRAA